MPDNPTAPNRSSRGRCTFRQRDITAAVRAMSAAGYEVKRIVIDRDGRIVVETNKSVSPEIEPTATNNPWDNV
jgi:hypothetical protein